MSARQLFTLEGKHILVTGASSGIGRAVCVMASELGAKLSMVARREDALRETLSQLSGDGHRFYVCDLSDVEAIEPLVKQIVADQGPLDGLMHCAGFAEDRGLQQCKPTYVKNMFDIHVFAFVELVRCASKKKMFREGASFLGTTSSAAFSANVSQTAYAAAKGAVRSAISPLSKELARKQIRINTVAYSMIRTAMYEGFVEEGGDAGLLASQYLGVGEPEDAAASACFLLSDAAKFITGTNMIVDGGALS